MPAERTRAARTLALTEREEISRGLAHGETIRRIARQLGRAPSTVSREIRRHGGQWAMYAFDTTEKAHVGRRGREWTAVGETEVACVTEMARCLREISEERVPE